MLSPMLLSTLVKVSIVYCSSYLLVTQSQKTIQAFSDLIIMMGRHTPQEA